MAVTANMAAIEKGLISTIMEILCKLINMLNIMGAFEKLKHSKVEQASEVQPCSQAVSIAVENASSFFNRLDSYYCCRDRKMTAVKEALRRKDFKPLKGLVDLLLQSLPQGKQFDEVKETCKEASEKCNNEAVKCKHLAITAQSRKRSTWAIGGMTAAGALAGGVALSVVGGVFTFGIDNHVGLRVTAGVFVVLITRGIANNFTNTEKELKELGRNFDLLASAAFRLHKSVLELHTILKGIAQVLENVDQQIDQVASLPSPHVISRFFSWLSSKLWGETSTSEASNRVELTLDTLSLLDEKSELARTTLSSCHELVREQKQKLNMM